MKLEVASLTDTGLVRQSNEDAFGHFEPADRQQLEEYGRLFLVADGMGGHRGGEIASEIAVQTIYEAYYDIDGGDRGKALSAALGRANRRILEQSSHDANLMGMGTTCTAMAIHGNKAYFGHVGDSRAYVCRDGELVQITQDHSLVGEMVRSGIITDEDARTHPKRNVITRSLGIQDNLTTDTPLSPYDLKVDDVFLLCSDGLIAHVKDSEIERVISSTPPELACRELIDLANSRGGRDNITLLVIKVLEM